MLATGNGILLELRSWGKDGRHLTANYLEECGWEWLDSKMGFEGKFAMRDLNVVPKLGFDLSA